MIHSFAYNPFFENYNTKKNVPIVLLLPQGNAGIHESARRPAKHLRGQKCPIQSRKENTKGWGR